MELETKIEHLNRANSELKNLMEVIEVSILIIDRHFCIKHYTNKIANISRKIQELNSYVDNGLSSIRNLTHDFS